MSFTNEFEIATIQGPVVNDGHVNLRIILHLGYPPVGFVITRSCYLHGKLDVGFHFQLLWVICEVTIFNYLRFDDRLRVLRDGWPDAHEYGI